MSLSLSAAQWVRGNVRRVLFQPQRCLMNYTEVCPLGKMRQKFLIPFNKHLHCSSCIWWYNVYKTASSNEQQWWLKMTEFVIFENALSQFQSCLWYNHSCRGGQQKNRCYSDVLTAAEKGPVLHFFECGQRNKLITHTKVECCNVSSFPLCLWFRWNITV